MRLIGCRSLFVLALFAAVFSCERLDAQNFGIQRAVAKDTVLAVSYVGSHGYSLLVQNDHKHCPSNAVCP